MSLLPGRVPRPHEIVAGCSWCGKWMRSPWRGRYAEDVGIEPVRAYMEGITGKPSRGKLIPTPMRPGGMTYARDEEHDEPYSGSICEECSRKQSEESNARIERMQGVLQAPEPEESAPPGAEEEKKEKKGGEGE